MSDQVKHCGQYGVCRYLKGPLRGVAESIAQMAQHLARRVEPAIMAEAAGLADALVLAKAEQIFLGPNQHFNATQRAILELPVRLGGIGLTFMSCRLHDAFFSSVASTIHILYTRLKHAAPGIAQHFDDIHNNYAFVTLRNSHQHVFAFLDENPADVPESFSKLRDLNELTRQPFTKVQQQLTTIRNERALRQLLLTCAPAVRSKIRSAGGQGAGDFVYIAPNYSKQFPDHIWLAAVKARLHLPLLPSGTFTCPGRD